MVVVTTSHRGVFYGEFEKQEAKVVTLKEARNCIYWSSDVNGFVGLAANGPTDDCRIGPAAPKMELQDVTAVLDCTEKAVKAWKKA